MWWTRQDNLDILMNWQTEAILTDTHTIVSGYVEFAKARSIPLNYQFNSMNTLQVK